MPSFYKTECQPLSLIDAIVSQKVLIVSDNPYLIELSNEFNRIVLKLPLDIKNISDLLYKSFNNFDTKNSYLNTSKIKKFQKKLFEQNIKEFINKEINRYV